MMHEPGLMPRPGILDISPYIGGEAKAAGVERPIRLASNESALGPSSKAMAAYRALAGEIHRYPDGNSEALREALGQRYGVDPARIVCGAGSDELITLLGFVSHLGPIADWGLEFENKRQIRVTPSMETNLPGIYAAGDVAGYPGKITLITIGMGEAAIAANNAVAEIRGEKVQPKYSTD